MKIRGRKRGRNLDTNEKSRKAKSDLSIGKFNLCHTKISMHYPLIPSPYHSAKVARHEVETGANEHVTVL